MKRELVITARSRKTATKKLIASHSQRVIDIVEELYYGHGVRPSSRTILYRLKKDGSVSKKDSKKVEALVAYLKLTGKIQTHTMIDAKRSMYGTSTYPDAQTALDELATGFKLDLWKNQPHRLLIMCEAVGYTDVIAKVANEYRCDYIGSGGDISVQWKINIAKNNYTHIVYTGDMDVKGISIPKTVIKDINELQDDAGSDLTTLVRIEHDVEEYDVELENVDVEHVRNLIEDEIVKLIDMEKWIADKAKEESEKEYIVSSETKKEMK